MTSKAGQSILWLLIGMVVMGVAVWVLMPSMMLKVHKSPLGYDATVAALRASIEDKQNWQVSHTFDFQRNIDEAGHGPIEQIGLSCVRRLVDRCGFQS